MCEHMNEFVQFIGSDRFKHFLGDFYIVCRESAILHQEDARSGIGVVECYSSLSRSVLVPWPKSRTFLLICIFTCTMRSMDMAREISENLP